MGVNKGPEAPTSFLSNPSRSLSVVVCLQIAACEKALRFYQHRISFSRSTIDLSFPRLTYPLLSTKHWCKVDLPWTAVLAPQISKTFLQLR